MRAGFPDNVPAPSPSCSAGAAPAQCVMCGGGDLLTQARAGPWAASRFPEGLVQTGESLQARGAYFPRGGISGLRVVQGACDSQPALPPQRVGLPLDPWISLWVSFLSEAVPD